jgi:hypothetical protein
LFSLDSIALFRAVTYQKIGPWRSRVSGSINGGRWHLCKSGTPTIEINHRRSRESFATSDDALAAAFRCRGSAAAYLQLIENLMKVPFRCPDANRKPLGDLPIRKAEIDQAKRLHLL